MTSGDDDDTGHADLAPALRALLVRVRDGDDAARPELLARVADVVDAFARLDLLQFVFVPSAEDDGSEPVTIDLIDPAPVAAPVAWFGVDEAGYDEFREAVALFGDVTDVLNPPIVLDVDEGEDADEDGDGGADAS